MDTRSLQDKMVQDYEKELKKIIPDRYQKKITSEVLRELNRAVMILAVERDFEIMRDALILKQKWMRYPVARLIYDLADLSMIPGFGGEVQKGYHEFPEDCRTAFEKCLGIRSDLYEIEDALKEFSELKTSQINSLFYDLTRGDDSYDPAARGEITRILSVDEAKISGSLADRLIFRHLQLCDLFPEWQDQDFQKKVTYHQCKFIVEQDPSEMDNLTRQVIALLSEAMKSRRASDLVSGTRERVLEAIKEAKEVRFTE